MSRGKNLLILSGILCLMLPVLVSATVPQTINFQGYLTDPLGAPVNSTLSITFRIFDAATNGNLLWSETQPSVAVTTGVFNVVLGTGMTFPGNLFDNSNQLYLEIQ